MNRRNAIALAAGPGLALILRPANAIIQASDPDLALSWQHQSMIAAGLGKFLADPVKRAFAVQPNQPGFTTVWGGFVGQPGTPLIAYPRFPETPPGTNYTLGGTALLIVSLTATGPWGLTAGILGTAAAGQGAIMGASAAMNPPTAVTVFSPLVDGVNKSIGMQGAWVIQFIRVPEAPKDSNYGNGNGPFGPFDPSQLPACVQVDSILPGGRRAGDVMVGDMLLLSDGDGNESEGKVTYSARKRRHGYRLMTQSGIALTCSATAPIRTDKGFMLALDVLGERVATMCDGRMRYEVVETLDFVGGIDVQHLTVGDRAFWAGAQQDAFILHHNLKEEGGN